MRDSPNSYQIEYLRMKKNDHRRLKMHCVFYYANNECLKKNHCNGSAHCGHYSESLEALRNYDELAYEQKKEYFEYLNFIKQTKFIKMELKKEIPNFPCSLESVYTKIKQKSKIKISCYLFYYYFYNTFCGENNNYYYSIKRNHKGVFIETTKHINLNDNFNEYIIYKNNDILENFKNYYKIFKELDFYRGFRHGPKSFCEKYLGMKEKYSKYGYAEILQLFCKKYYLENKKNLNEYIPCIIDDEQNEPVLLYCKKSNFVFIEAQPLPTKVSIPSLQSLETYKNINRKKNDLVLNNVINNKEKKLVSKGNEIITVQNKLVDKNKIIDLYKNELDNYSKIIDGINYGNITHAIEKLSKDERTIILLKYYEITSTNHSFTVFKQNFREFLEQKKITKSIFTERIINFIKDEVYKNLEKKLHEE